MLSSAPERLNRRPTPGERAQGMLLALLVQASFLLLVFFPPSHSVRTEVEKETLLLLPPLIPPKPTTIDARAPRTLRTARPVVPPPSSAPVMIAPLAPPAGLAGFGRSLFGCAPEHYADLPPDEKARCLKPGEGMAAGQPPDLMGGPSHVKDNPRWANAMAHKQTLRMMPGGLLFPLVALGAVLDGSISEPNSAFRDPEQWPNERDPSQFMPHDLHEQERVYDAWRKDHPIPPPKRAADR